VRQVDLTFVEQKWALSDARYLSYNHLQLLQLLNLSDILLVPPLDIAHPNRHCNKRQTDRDNKVDPPALRHSDHRTICCAFEIEDSSAEYGLLISVKG
jgi:hypothetical protein